MLDCAYTASAFNKFIDTLILTYYLLLIIYYFNLTITFLSLTEQYCPESLISILESMAAGAMLTVISETMLPEAYAKGGSIVGLSTLGGFLVIIMIKTWF